VAEDTEVSRVEDATTWEDLEKLAAYSEERSEPSPSVEAEAEPAEQAQQEAPSADYIEIDGQKISRDQLLQEYRLFKNQADQLARYTTLLRTLEDRSLHPKWRAAFHALLDPNWESHVVDDEDEEEEESEDESLFDVFEEEKPKQKKTEKSVPEPVVQKISEVEARLAEIERAKAERDMIAYIEDFEKRYGKLSAEDFQSLEATADRYRVLGAQGWWTPEHGNPIEVIARLDPKLSSRVLGNGTKEAATAQPPQADTERQAKQKRMAQQGSSAKGETGAGKRDISSALDELEAALRRSMRYVS